MTSSIRNQPTDIQERMRNIRSRLERQRLDATNKKIRDEGFNMDRMRYHQMMLRREELLDRLKAVKLTPNARPSSRLSLPDLSRPTRPRPERDSHIKPAVEERKEWTDGPFNFSIPELKSAHHSGAYRPLPTPSWPLYTTPYQTAAIPTMHQLPILTQPPIVGAAALVPSQTPVPAQKTDFHEMMMMQNTQMHQYFMHHLLLNSTAQKQSEPKPIVVEKPVCTMPSQQIITIPLPGNNTTVHHHHLDHQPEDSRPVRYVERPRSPPPIPQPERHQRQPWQVIRKHGPAPVRVREPRIERKHPFPGSEALRKLRRIFYAAWFISFLKLAARKRAASKVDDKFIFGIQLKEAMATIHGIYLNPDGKIFPVLTEAVGVGTSDFTKVFDGNQKVLQHLAFIIESIIYNITDVMPLEGLLGIHRKSVIYKMIQPGKQYPDGYFWSTESSLITIDEDGKTGGIDDNQAKMLIIGMFVSRSLITTLLMKPLDYGLSTELLDEVAEGNLRLLSSVMLYIARRASSPSNTAIMPMPYELAAFLYSDDELTPILEKIRETVNSCSRMLTNWAEEYIVLLRNPDQSRQNIINS